MIGKRFKVIRSTLNLSLTDFSKKLFLSKSAVSKIENDITVPSHDTLVSMKKHFNININWLLTGEGEMFQVFTPVQYSLPEEELILPIEGEISAGEPIAVFNQEPLAYINVSRILDKNKIHCFRVNGRSMEPLIQHNDIVILKKTESWDCCEQKVCAVRINGELTLKVLYVNHDRNVYVLMPVNNEFKPIIIEPETTDIKLVGTLVYTVKEW